MAANENENPFQKLIDALKATLPELEQELDDRQTSGNDEDTASLEEVVAKVKAALAEFGEDGQ